MSVPPEHNYVMPHDASKEGRASCPPNCPYRLWYDKRYDLGVQMAQKVQQEWEEMARTIPPEQDAAFDFMQKCGLDPTPDAIGQLAEVFLPCLKIMCERPWSPDGATWRKSGVLGALSDIRKKFERLWERGWQHGKRHDDSGYDLINYIAFYLRSDDNRWGDWGEPG